LSRNLRRLGILLAVSALGGALLAVGCRRNSASFSPSAGERDDDNEDAEDGLDVPGSVPPTSGGESTPIPSKIRYVLVVVKENHTFDNYFTDFPGAESSKTATLMDGGVITRERAPTELMKDICHANSCGQRAFNNGAMNGFDAKDPVRPFYFYAEDQIPNYWRYAREFVLADHFFSTTLGPSTPGHTVFWTGQSMVLDNAVCQVDGGECKGRGCKAGADIKITSYNPDDCTTAKVTPCFDVPSLTDHLPKGFTWANYGGAIAQMVKSVAAAPDYATHFRKQAELVTDLRGGHLANLTVAHLWSGPESEHPAAYPCEGEGFTVDVVNAAMQLPQWKEMAIVVTWDDWGGFYDHVPPPVQRCKNGKVFQSGFRLPALVISPYAKKAFILKTPSEQASVTKLVEELWGMEFMTKRDPHARDGTAGSMMTAFDFEQPARAPMLLTKNTCPAPKP